MPSFRVKGVTRARVATIQSARAGTAFRAAACAASASPVAASTGRRPRHSTDGSRAARCHATCSTWPPAMAFVPCGAPKRRVVRGWSATAGRRTSACRTSCCARKRRRPAWTRAADGPALHRKEEAEYKEADAIFVPSTFARQSFLRLVSRRDKVVAIPIGIRLEEFFPVPKCDDTFRVLCVAMVSVRKGIGYLLEAMSRLALPKSEVVLRGTVLPESRRILSPLRGPVQASAASAEKRGCATCIRRHPSSCCRPSRTDSVRSSSRRWPAAFPVIATTNTGGPDVITDGKDGFIVPIQRRRAPSPNVSTTSTATRTLA